MKRVNGVVMADQIQWQKGTLNRTLYLLPTGHNSDEGFKFYTGKLKSLGANSLFECQRFSCGASNFWANDIFEIPRLYGQDKDQLYYVGQFNNAIYVVYSVRRGNGRVYTLVDEFTPEAVRATSNLFNKNDEFSVKLSDVNAMKTSLKPLVDRLREDQTAEGLLIIHSGLPSSVEGYDRLLQTMRIWQADVSAVFNRQGVSSKRYRIHLSVCKLCGEQRQQESILLDALVLSKSKKSK